MEEAEKKAALEATLAQMRTPVRDVAFAIIIKAMCGHEVIRLDRSLPEDVDLVEKLNAAIRICAAEVNETPIHRPRPNEVGNDIEAYVMRALPKAGLTARRPTSMGGTGQSTGYPDILVQDDSGRFTYLECKVFTDGTLASSMRSFYLSPSETFKVAQNARHLLLAFGMVATVIPGSRDSNYVPTSFKLIDLHDLTCNVKFEFNANNVGLYAPSMILSQGSV